MNTLIYFLSAFCAAIFGIRAYQKKSDQPEINSYMWLCFVTTLAFLGFGGHLLFEENWLRRLFYVAMGTLPVLMLRFAYQWQKSQKEPTWVWYVSVLSGALFLMFDLNITVFRIRIAIAEGLVLSWFFVGSCVCASRLYQWKKEAHGEKIKSQRLLHLLLLFSSTIIMITIEGVVRFMFATEVTDGLGLWERNSVLQGLVPPFGAALTVLMLYILHLNTKLTRLVGVHELFAQLGATFIAAAILGALVCMPLFLRSGYRLHTAFQILLVIILFLSVYPMVITPINSLMTRWFNRYGRQLEIAITQIEKRLPEVLSIDNLEHMVLQRIHDAGRTQMVSLYLLDQDRDVFVLKKSFGPDKPLEAVSRSPFVSAFRVGGFIEAEKLSPNDPKTGFLFNTMKQMKAEYSFPLWSDEIVMGWINLQSDQWSGGFSREERNRLRKIVDGISIALTTIKSIDRLKEQHRLAALGVMSAGLAHEIRNPLAGIKGAAQYLQESPTLEETQEFLKLIVNEVDRLNTVVSQFLDYSRPMQIQRELCDINSLLIDSVEIVKADPRNEGIEFQTFLSEQVTPIAIDPTKIQQVILNLLQNGAQSMPEKGTVSIRTKLSRATFPPYQGQPTVELEISDTGPGIPTEIREKLFIPFFTTKQRGTGLGLPICQRLIEAHGGELNFYTQAGIGTRFVAQIPIMLTSK